MAWREDVDLDRVAHVAARRLRQSLLGQLGLISPLVLGACAASEPDTGEEGGVTTNPSSSSASSASTSSGESGEAEAEAESGVMDEGTDTGPKLDMSHIFDAPPDAQTCWNTWFFDEAEATALYPDCSLTVPDGVEWTEYAEVCVDKPPEGCASICDDQGLCAGMQDCLWTLVYDSCGVFEGEDSCCTLFAMEPLPPVGRPFWVSGERGPRLAEPGPEARAQLGRVAAHWLETARGEHASVAAFARFVVSLQRLGAPARLVAEALRAASDELRHTEAALGLASRFAGRALELGPLDVTGAIERDEDLAQLVEAAIVEGCIGETLAAHEAASLAACARDAEVAAVLDQIAADEARHAALAWRFVAWAIAEQPRLAAHVRSVLAAAIGELDGPARGPALAVDEAAALALGCPPPGLRARWRAAAVHAVIEPCAAGLVAKARGVG